MHIIYRWSAAPWNKMHTFTLVSIRCMCLWHNLHHTSHHIHSVEQSILHVFIQCNVRCNERIFSSDRVNEKRLLYPLLVTKNTVGIYFALTFPLWICDDRVVADQRTAYMRTVTGCTQDYTAQRDCVMRTHVSSMRCAVADAVLLHGSSMHIKDLYTS